MERLFNNDYSLTEVGKWLDIGFSKYLEKIFTEYSEYSIRELSHLLTLAVQLIECEFILRDRDRECELISHRGDKENVS